MNIECENFKKGYPYDKVNGKKKEIEAMLKQKIRKDYN